MQVIDEVEVIQENEILDIKIRSNTYRVSCPKGDREKVLDLADRFCEEVSIISKLTKGKGSDALIFLLSGLQLQDKLYEVERRLINASHEIESLKSQVMHLKESLYEEEAFTIEVKDRVLTNITRMVEKFSDDNYSRRRSYHQSDPDDDFDNGR